VTISGQATLNLAHLPSQKRDARRFGPRVGVRLMLVAGLAAGPLVMSGCEVDSYMDPSVVGRWEHTPTVVPILERLASVEGPPNEGVETTKVRPEDLIPEVQVYRIGPGDRLEIRIQDLFATGQREEFAREVDPRGFIDLPQVPAISVDRLSAEQVQEAIAKAYRDAAVLANPIIEVQISERRRLTFNVIGAVGQPGLYQIPRPDYRLLEAVNQAGRVTENVQSVFVIRQIPLTPEAEGRTSDGTQNQPSRPTTPTTTDSTSRPSTPANEPRVIELIDELSKPPANPGRVAGSQASAQPIDNRRRAAIDLEQPNGAAAPAATPSNAAASASNRGDTKWIFRDGQWVPEEQSVPAAPPAVTTGNGRRPAEDLPAGPNGARPAQPTAPAAQNILTQRVIEVPMAALLAGSANVNIVIRPGDIIRVPSPAEGLVYVTGQVQRPGPYNLPQAGRLTLTRSITAAGGLSSTAIPERVDITRMVGPDRQAIVRVNLRAIYEGTQPDLFLRADDQVNVGTNFFALPLAVLRNGFRASYGFGFILDRNFGFDVFGPQQTSTNSF
jgi:polysaccharide export outer membrane protein